MTMLDKMRNGEAKPETPPPPPTTKNDTEENKQKKEDETSDSSQLLSQVESQFKNMMSEFQANAGFRVDTGEQAIDTMIEVMSDKGVVVSIAVLLSYIRYCINHGVKKDITLKIGYNKPAPLPMNFAINEELLEEIYPSDTVEIN